jgi:hypothetical protein
MTDATPAADVRGRTTGGPLRTVLAAVESGAATVADVAQRTGLDRDVVAAAIQYLVRTGRVGTASLTSACPSTACGGCALACPSP